MEYQQIGFNATRNCFNDQTIKLPTTVLWEFKHNYPLIDTTLATKDYILVAANEASSETYDASSIFCIDRMDGKLMWEQRFNDTGLLSLCLFQDLIVVITHSKRMLGIKEGTIVWESSDKNNIMNPHPMIVEDLISVQKSDRLELVSPLDGKSIYHFPERRPLSFACADNVIVIENRSEDGEYFLSAYDISTKNKIWRTSLSEPGDWTDNGTTFKARIGLFPIIIGKSVYASLGRYVCSFDLMTGVLNWKTVATGQVIKAGDSIYCFSGYDLFCIEATTGTITKTVDLRSIGAFRHSIPFISDGIILLGTQNGLFAVDVITNEIKWEFHSKRKSGSFLSQPVALDGRIYAGCNDGYIYCFG